MIDSGSILPATGQSIFFDWISIIYLLIVVASVFVGIKKGFLYSLVSFFGLAVAILVAFFVAKPLGEWIASSTGWGTKVTESVYNWLVSKNDALSLIINKTEAQTLLPGYFEQSGLPTAVANLLIPLIIPLIPDIGTKAIGTYMAEGVSGLAFTAGSFIVVFIIMLIIVAILKHFTNKINKIAIIGGLNRLLGAVMGVAIGVVFVSVISYGLNFFTCIPEVNTFIVGQLKLDDPSSWSIGKMIYEQNFIQQLINMYIAA